MNQLFQDPPLIEGRVLVIEQNQESRARFAALLAFMERNAVVLDEGDDWCTHLLSGPPVDAMVLGACDLKAVVQEAWRCDPDLPVLLFGHPERQGADFGAERNLLHPIDAPITYRGMAEALRRARLYRTRRADSDAHRPVKLFRSLIGNSRGMRDARRLIEQVAESDATVLIRGESGTGKEVVARNIHYLSARRERPFVPINCGAIPSELLESELFGHEKGAFTGAVAARQGRFELAEGGTLFLDEIGDMPLPMQVKLLRVLQERVFERVGSNRSTPTNVRVVAATHRNLEELIENGRFREDLYYRLNVFPIETPPLRERVEDIPLLIQELIARIERDQRGSVRLTPAAVIALCQYAWPGNVRELANLIERLSILFPLGVVGLGDLPEKYRAGMPGEAPGHPDPFPDPDTANDPAHTPLFPEPAFRGLGLLGPAIPDPSEVRLPRAGLNLKNHLNTIEMNLIRQALKAADGVVAHAATLLQMRRTTLVEKLRKYGLHRDEDTTIN